jgi:hypothetical protein
MDAKRLGVVLACFEGSRTSAKVRRSIISDLKSIDEVVCDSVVVRVKERQRVTLYDPGRVRAGAMTAALTWAVFGALTGGGGRGFVVWGVIGAACGAAFAYAHEHLLTTAQLERLGTRLPGNTSALLMFVETTDAARLLKTTVDHGATVASVAVIDDELHAETVSTADGGESSGDAVALSMLIFRYRDQPDARQIAASILAAHDSTMPQVELVVERDPTGRLRVVDPMHGVHAMAKSDVVSWGGLGLVLGAIAGAVAGGGVLGFLAGGLVTGVVWGLFGLAAGALYGLWAGRAASARSAKSMTLPLSAGGSSLLAWADGRRDTAALEAFNAPGSRCLEVSFAPTRRGAVITS